MWFANIFFQFAVVHFLIYFEALKFFNFGEVSFIEKKKIVMNCAFVVISRNSLPELRPRDFILF